MLLFFRTHLLVLVFVSSKLFAQNPFTQVSHLPSNFSAICPEIILPTQDSGAWLITKTYAYNYTLDNQQKTFTKVDKYGNPLLGKYIALAGSQIDIPELFSACNTLDNGIVTCGLKGSNAFVIRLNSNADVIWCKTIDPQYSSNFRPNAIIACKDSGFVIAGAHGYIDVYLIKIDKNGNLLWAGLETDIVELGSSFLCLTEGPDSSIYVGGAQRYTTQDSHPLLMKFTKNGIPVWKKVLLPNSPTFAKNKALSSILFANGKLYASITNYDSVQIAVIRPDGALQWAKTVSEFGYFFSPLYANTSLIQDDANHIYLSHSSLFLSLDSLAQVRYGIYSFSNTTKTSYSILRGQRLMQVKTADLWSSGPNIPSLAYTVTTNHAPLPSTNQCFSLINLQASNYSMRDSVISTMMINTGTISSLGLSATGLYTVQFQSACSYPTDNASLHYSSQHISISPNPCSNHVKIYSEVFPLTSYCIYSADGKLLTAKDLSIPQSTILIEFENLKQGIYILRAKTTNGEIYTKKLLRTY